ncbi:hypothetical protein APHAL10511_005546 [Amanita phalloides]|nr:hypothetical protein APHAL10511_005546 [Amanita phalloides]
MWYYDEVHLDLLQSLEDVHPVLTSKPLQVLVRWLPHLAEDSVSSVKPYLGGDNLWPKNRLESDTTPLKSNDRSSINQAAKPRPKPASNIKVTEKKELVGHTSTCKEKFRNKVATWQDKNENEVRQVAKSSRKMSKSTEIEKELETVVKYEDSTEVLTTIKFTPSGGVNLKEQLLHIQAIISLTINLVLCDMMLENTFPEKSENIENLSEYVTLFAIEAASNHGHGLVANHLKGDQKYRDAFMKIPKDRVSHF